MGTLLSLMQSSLSALQADQAALNVTSNNVANQNTVGYTREIVQFANDSVSLSNGTTSGVNVGSGAISQRDRVLEQRVQQQTQVQSQSATAEAALQQIENVFSLSSTSSSASTTAIGSAMDTFFSSLTALASNPSDTSTRQAVLTAASSMVSTFNSALGQLSSIGSSLDQESVSIVSQVNSLTTTIAGLNTQIASSSPTADAGTLEDQRQAAIAQLSQLIGLNQISTENNGIALTTANGQVLVSGSTAYALQATQVGGSTHILAGATGEDITGEITGGQLGGVLSVRDGELAQVSSSLYTLAFTVQDKFGGQNSQGVDEYGNTGGYLIGVSPSGAFYMATTDPNSIATAAIGEGSAGNGNAQALAALATASIVDGTTATNFYAALLSQVGNAVSSATTDSTQQQTALTQLTTQRDALSGVSLDQEASNLTQYQRSYEAAARVFSIVDTLMADAINLGQTTAVS